MKLEGFLLNICRYNAIVGGFCRKGLIQQAYKVLRNSRWQLVRGCILIIRGPVSVSDTYPIRIRGGYAPDAYPRRIGVSPSELAWKLALRYVSEGGIRPISIPPPGLPDALQNRTRRHSVCPHARGRCSRGRLAARRRRARRRRATGDETQPLEKLLPPARRRLAAGPVGGGQACSEKEVGARHRSAKSELR